MPASGQPMRALWPVYTPSHRLSRTSCLRPRSRMLTSCISPVQAVTFCMLYFHAVRVRNLMYALCETNLATQIGSRSNGPCAGRHATRMSPRPGPVVDADKFFFLFLQGRTLVLGPSTRCEHLFLIVTLLMLCPQADFHRCFECRSPESLALPTVLVLFLQSPPSITVILSFLVIFDTIPSRSVPM